MVATFSCLHRCGDVKVNGGKFYVAYDTELSETNMNRLLRFAQPPDHKKVIFWASSDLLWFDDVQFKDGDKTVSKEVWQETCLRKLRGTFPAFEIVDLGSLVVPVAVAIDTTTSHFSALRELQSRMLRKSNRTEYSLEFAQRVAATYVAEGVALAKSPFAKPTFYTHEESWIYYANLLLGEKMLDVRMF